MRHFERAKQFTIGFHEGVESGQVGGPHACRRNRAAATGLQIFEDARFGERKFQFLAIQDLKDHDFVAVEAELLEAKRDFFRWFEQIGKK